MRVLIATPLYPPDIGGPATYTKFLERHLPLQGINFDVVSFHTVRAYPKIARHVLYTIQLLIKGWNADIVYALDPVSVGVPSWMVSFILRKKLYLRVPGDYAWEQGQQRFGITDTLDGYRQKNKKPIMVKFLAGIQSCVARHATRVIVPSDYMKEVVTEWGVDVQRITRIYSALNPVVLQETKQTLREKFGYAGFVVTTSARLVPWKGIEGLIMAMIRLHKSGIEVSLEVIGDGTLRAHLESVVAQEKADAYIHIRGKVGREELVERIAASDAFVLNTSYEGLSHQLLEVMDIGVPIVTTSVGGNKELITHEAEGLIVPFNDVRAISEAITSIRVDGASATERVQCAHQKVRSFREDKIIPEIVKLFT
jgi:glycosyltransferase involved in cell wall biosynthesis